MTKLFRPGEITVKANTVAATRTSHNAIAKPTAIFVPRHMVHRRQRKSTQSVDAFGVTVPRPP